MEKFLLKKREHSPKSDKYCRIDVLNTEISETFLFLKMFYKSLLLRIDLISCQEDIP